MAGGDPAQPGVKLEETSEGAKVDLDNRAARRVGTCKGGFEEGQEEGLCKKLSGEIERH